jgi:hypothetical protein
MYMASFNSAIAHYRELLSGQSAGNLKLPNENLDVGAFTPAGKYKLTDAAYSQLLHKLQGHYTEMPPELRGDVLAFYHDLNAPNSTKADDKDWAKVLKELDQLRAVDLDLARNGSIHRGGDGLHGSEVSAGVEIPPRQ